MSYARFSAGDVYVYLDTGGYLTCCSCPLMPVKDNGWHEWFKAYSTEEMLRHLDAHRDAGHNIGDRTYDGLRRDQEENDLWLATR